jgi:hypothetical protein
LVVVAGKIIACGKRPRQVYSCICHLHNSNKAWAQHPVDVLRLLLLLLL